MNSKAEQAYYKRKGLPANSKYEFKGDELINKSDGRIHAATEDKSQIIEAFLKDPRTAGGRDRLWGHIRQQYDNISRDDVSKFLANDPTHQIHKPLNRRVTSRPIIVKNRATVAQIDLIDMQKFTGYNGQKRYILTYVDLFSKWCAARALPNKNQPTVVAALANILDSMPASWRPRTIQADNGSEFQTQMENMLTARRIKLVHSSPYNPSTQGQIERLNRSLKSMIFEYFTRAGTKNYIDHLQDFVDNLNNTKHKSTGYTAKYLMELPSLSPELIKEIQDRMRKLAEQNSAIQVEPQEFKVGDYVRIALTANAAVRKNAFRKKIDANWSPTVFQIHSISEPTTAGAQPTYLLTNLETNRKWLKRFRADQLQKTNKPTLETVPESLEPFVMEEKYNEPEEEKAPAPPAPPRRSARAWQPRREALRHFAMREDDED